MDFVIIISKSALTIFLILLKMKEHNVSEFFAKTAYLGKSRSRVKGQIRAQFGPKSTFLIFIPKPFNIFF